MNACARLGLGSYAVALLLLLTALPALSQEPPPPAVGVTTVVKADVTPKHRFTGRAEAIDRVDLIARVDGFLEQRNFVQGGPVTNGEVLFVIEKAPYEAALAQRQAELASAEADVEFAQAQLDRGETLLRGNNIPAAEVDSRRAELKVAEARSMEAEAAIRVAELDLSYTDVVAPVAGLIGRYNYSTGAFVGPDSGALATIVSHDPIYVTFPVSLSVLTEVRQNASESDGSIDVVALAELPTGKLYDHQGKIEFVDVQADASTDTLSVRAQFPNPDSLLSPGQFINVIIERDQPQSALVVPQAATLVDQAGIYVLVVGKDDTVEQRRVTLGEGAEGTNVVVASGLAEGDQVIVEGIQKVRPGQKVTPSPVSAAAPS